MWHLWMLFVGVSLSLAPTGRALICTRRPANTATPKSPVDENYVISISGNPETYILGQEYNVSLNSFNGHRYISFILALESEEGDYQADLGRFELSNLIETRFSPNCINMVENTNTNPKTHMHLTWTAPSEPGSGCILIRATVLQHRDVWHMDDGGLTRRICEEVVDDVESQPTGSNMNSPCCACDEARYELTFEGVWSRNLHPRYFPARGWETRFCELVGAAHSSDYRFWESGVLASEAVKQYAEHCTSRLLEREFSLNFREQKIRTIIKARGPAFPNLNSKTMASVRVDPVHHMVSFASKIEPSPDWIVGVSGLELCLRNCTWLESKTINLYPWDVGTDAGPTYTSPDQPQVPPDVIRRIRSDFPNDPRSPFYDESGEPLKPMAILTIRRQRIYERRCLDEDSNNDADVPRECLTHPWSGWSDCSTKCGEGMQYRRRVYKQPELARIYKCNVMLYEERACEGQECGLSEPMRNAPDYDELNMNFGTGMGRDTGMGQQSGMYTRRAECQLSPWSGWGPCSVTCGEGHQTRQRQYLSRGAEIKCQSVHRVELQEMRSCVGRACLGNLQGGDIDPRFEDPQPEEEVEPLNRNNFNSNGEEPTDENPRLSPFDVGNLKGVSSQWNQDQKTDSLWKPNRRQPDINQASNYGQFPRLEDAERSSWQRRRPVDGFKQKEEDRFTDQKERFGNSDYANPKPDDEDDSQRERTPWQRPNNNFNKQDQRFNSQRQGYSNTDYTNANLDNDEAQPERTSWQRPSNNFNKLENQRQRFGNRNNPEDDNTQLERSPWQRPNNLNNYGRDLGNINSNTADNDAYMSKHCFQMLRTNPSCQNQTIIGNFWFYNFCVDECMLYAADPCDRNVNKFSRWETCEECRRPEFQQLQQNAAASPECQNILATQRAQEQFWNEERVNSYPRRNYRTRQWG